MIITIKEIEIDLALSELNELPQYVRKNVLEHIATETEIEVLKKQMAKMQTESGNEISTLPKQRKKANWTPERRAAASERMKRMRADKFNRTNDNEEA